MKNTENGRCIVKFLDNEIQKCHALIDLLKDCNDRDNLNEAIGFLSALLMVKNFVNVDQDQSLISKNREDIKEGLS